MPPPAAIVPAPRPGESAILAIPGLTVPPVGPRVGRSGLAARSAGAIVGSPAPALVPGPPSTLDPGSEPTLDGPLEMPDGPRPIARAAVEPGDDFDATLPRLDRAANDDPVVLDPLQPATRTDPIADRPLPAPRRVEPSRPSRPGSTALGDGPPPRRGRFFGLLGAASAPVVSSAALRPGTGDRPGDIEKRPLAGGLAGDPDRDALAARIEKQARLAVGPRVRALDVRLDQKTAVIQARGVKFLQKRGVRKSLESLPALGGLPSRIEFLD